MSRKELKRLYVGFKRFRTKYFEGENSLYQKLALSGQTPATLIIGCTDSRVDPALLSSSEPGDLFVVRNVGNLVPPCDQTGAGFHGVSSAIEFAVVNLKVKNIIILGHQKCGGVRALMAGVENEPPSFINSWVSIADEAKQKVLSELPDASLEEQCSACELESIRISMRNLRTFPFVRKAIEQNQLDLIGAYFDIEQGRLLEFHEDTGEFTALVI